MPSRLISIPFALGFDEETASRELGAGSWRECINVRQRRGHAFGVRADYPSVAMTEFDGTLTPYDLYNLNGRLLALGNRQTLIVPAPTDVFEYVQQPAGNWKGTLPPLASGTRIPPVTDIRNMGQPPDGVSDVKTARIAALNGYVCLGYGFGGTAGGLTSYVHIFKADTDSTICFQAVAASNLRVVVSGNSFWILGVNSANDLVGFRFDTTSDNDLQNAVTLYVGTVTTNIFAADTVNSLSPAQFVFVVRDGSTTVVRRFNEAGVQQDTFAGPAVAADTMAIEADSIANEIVVAYRVGAADAFVQSYRLTTHASLAGPTAQFGEAVTGDLSLVRRSLGGSTGDLITEDSNLRTLRCLFVTATAAPQVVLPIHNYILAGPAVSSPLGTVQPMISDNGNQLLIYDALSTTRAYSAAMVDFRVAQDGDTGVAVGMGGQVCQDRFNGNVNAPYYWARIIEGTDGQNIPLVSQFRVASTAKRQSCQIGNVLFITGATPVEHDGRQIVENGFTERPVFSAAITQTSGGSLIPGASYDYVAIYRWTNSQNLETKSAVSDIQSVTMGTTNTATQSTVFAPHTLRRDASTGSAASIALYRTFASSVKTDAIVTSIRDFSQEPLTATELSGKTLVLKIDGGSNQTVTFGASDNTIVAVKNAINAQTTLCTATISDDGVHIDIKSDLSGSGTVDVVSGTATTPGVVGFCGFFAGQSAEGTVTFTKGSVFHRVALFPVPLGDEFGAAITIFDGMSNDTLLTQETLYTQGERGALTGILEHESAGPCKYCWTVGARVFIGGLPDPSEVAISNELFPSEGLAFSSSIAFRTRVEGNVTAVAALDGIPIAFTRDAIFRFPGALPDDQGVDGDLGPPVQLPAEGGCSNAESILETSLGLFYQANDTKLMLMPRGNQSPIWAGKMVQDTLVSFPNITDAVYVDEDHIAVFTCQSAAGDASVVIACDLRLSGMTNQGFVSVWYKDTFTSAQIIKSAVDYLGRLAYIDGSVVRLQSSSLTPAAFIGYNTKTGSLEPFGGGSWGKTISITLEGTFRAQAQLRCRISYDDGVTFTNMKTFTFNAGFTAGDTVTAQWWPSIRKGTSYVLDFQVLTNGVPSEGIILNKYTIEVESAAPVKRQRTSAAERG